MLRLASEPGSEDEREPPSSPIRRLTQPVPRSEPYRAPSAGGHRADTEGLEESDDAEFVTSAPLGQSGREALGIKKDAFSPNYFQKFFTVESELGRGGKGVVLLVRHELDGPAVAAAVASQPRLLSSRLAGRLQAESLRAIGTMRIYSAAILQCG
jgi:hypothetical protein